MGNFTRGIEQRENSIENVTKKGTLDTMECESDHCQTTTKRKEYTTISESPQQLLYINVCRSLNMLDRSVANKAYYVHDQANN